MPTGHVSGSMWLRASPELIPDLPTPSSLDTALCQGPVASSFCPLSSRGGSGRVQQGPPASEGAGLTPQDTSGSSLHKHTQLVLGPVSGRGWMPRGPWRTRHRRPRGHSEVTSAWNTQQTDTWMRCPHLGQERGPGLCGGDRRNPAGTRKWPCTWARNAAPQTRPCIVHCVIPRVSSALGMRPRPLGPSPAGPGFRGCWAL